MNLSLWGAIKGPIVMRPAGHTLMWPLVWL